MKKILFSLTLLVGVCFGLNSYAIFNQDAASQALLVKANKAAPLEGLGDVVNHTKNLLKVVYDFAVLGGAATSIGLVDDQGAVAYLPKGAIVTNVVMQVLTQPLPSTTSVSLSLLATKDLMIERPQPAVGFAAGVPVGTAATWVGPVTAVAGTNPLAVFTTGSALTAGKIQWFIEYVIQ